MLFILRNSPILPLVNKLNYFFDCQYSRVIHCCNFIFIVVYYRIAGCMCESCKMTIDFFAFFAFFDFWMVLLLFVVHNCRNEEINVTKSDFFINIVLFVVQNFVLIMQ